MEKKVAPHLDKHLSNTDHFIHILITKRMNESLSIEVNIFNLVPPLETYRTVTRILKYRKKKTNESVFVRRSSIQKDVLFSVCATPEIPFPDKDFKSTTIAFTLELLASKIRTTLFLFHDPNF